LNQRQAASDDLQKVVVSPAASYQIRTVAAREQGRNALATTGSTGSRELDLLSNRTQLTAANADAPFFFAARMVAAEQNSNPSVRVQLLLGAVAERPDDLDVRRKLFSAAFDAQRYRLALAANRNPGQNDSEFTADIAEAHQQLGEFVEAVQLFKSAAAIEKDSARKQALEEKAKQAQVAQDRKAENERRRPVMRADLDQPNAVRRRLQ
jgi:hypothetical protein